MPAFPRLDWSRLQPSRNPWHLAGISAAAGFFLFLVVCLFSLGDDGKATAEAAKDGTSDTLALPVPLTDGQSVSHMQQPRFPQEAAPADAQAAAAGALPDPLAEPAPDAASTTATPSAAPANTPAAPTAGTPPPSTLPVPIPEQAPAPEYPASAMRSNSTGTVLLRVRVSAEGVPEDVEVIERSGDRTLDRAALSAIRQWRFTPAQQDGKPVAGSVDIPISFDLDK